MRTLTLFALLFGGVAVAQNPAPVAHLQDPDFVIDVPADHDAAAIGDLTGDGRPDLVYVHQATGALHLLPNGMGGRHWPDALGEPFDTIAPGARVAVADVDGDGDVDYVAHDPTGAGSVVFGLRRDDGTFAREVFAFDAALPSVASPGLTIGDITGDGRPEILVNDEHSQFVYREDGAWRSSRLMDFGRFGVLTQLGDVDADGVADILVPGSNAASLIRGDNVWPSQNGIANRGGWNVRNAGYAFANVIGGPGDDLIASNADGTYFGLAGNVFWRDLERTDYSPMNQPVPLDFDGDGDTDLVGVARDQPSSVLLLDNNGDDTMREVRHGGGNGGGRQFSGELSPADLDGDGGPELVVDYGAGFLMVYTVGRGVLSATHVSSDRTTLRGPARHRAGTVTVQPLVDLPDPVTVTEVRVQLDGAPAGEVLEAIEVVAPAADDAVVGRLEGAALAGELRVPLAGDGLLVTDGPIELEVYFIVRAGAYRVAPEVRVAWDTVAASFADGGPAPVVNQVAHAQTLTLENSDPVAEADAYDVPEGATTLLDVLANDRDADDDPLTIELVEPPRHGLAEVVDGQIRYTHDGSDAPLLDTLRYRVVDPLGAASEPVDVTLRIEPANDAPVAAPDIYVTAQDVPLAVDAELGVLLNDLDADSPVLTATLVDPPADGGLQFAPDGGFVYLPAPGFAGEVTFAYRAGDGEAESEPATVTIFVLPDDAPPAAAEGPFETGPGTAVVLDLSGDPADGPATLYIDGFPDHGHLVDLRPAEARVTYVPPTGFAGEARFTYRLSDGRVVSDIYEAVVVVGRP